MTKAVPAPVVSKPRAAPTKTNTPAPAADPDYGTCKNAKTHGKGPYYRGKDPEYYYYRDADHDGIVCE
ncbi:MAG: excalibur calcium-binding domain-containing protein [Candidatus Nanopelagicales bacterium]